MNPAARISRQELVTLLMGFAHAHHDRLSSRFSQLGITLTQGKALYYLDDCLSMRALADRMHCDASNLTGIVDRLEQLDLLRRQPDPTDRRLKLLVLTPEGRRVRELATAEMFDSPGLGRLSPSDEQTLASLMRTVMHDEGVVTMAFPETRQASVG